jgi:hypothetical protein
VDPWVLAVDATLETVRVLNGCSILQSDDSQLDSTVLGRKRRVTQRQNSVLSRCLVILLGCNPRLGLKVRPVTESSRARPGHAVTHLDS